MFGIARRHSFVVLPPRLDDPLTGHSNSVSSVAFSPDGRLQLEFTPFVERVAKANLLLITSEVHQTFGRYRGTVTADNGEVIHLDGLIGWVEEQHARW